MIIFGKRLSEYVAFSRLFLGLILVVGLLRLALSLAGAPNPTVKWVSISAVVGMGVLYYGIRVHSSGFGSYKQLLPIIFLMQGVVAQAVIITGIVISIVTGNDNVFSAPEYSFGGDGKTWLHVAAHLGIATTVGTLINWLLGSLVMFITKKLVTRPAAARRSSAF